MSRWTSGSAVIAALLTAMLTVSPAVASAAPGEASGSPESTQPTCVDGSRKQAAAVASDAWYNPVPIERWVDPILVAFPGRAPWTTVDSPVQVELRWAPDMSCGWSVVDGGSMSQTWLDRTSDGGRSWETLGFRDVHVDYYTTFTGLYGRGPGQMIRACASTHGLPLDNPARCTLWY